jgi:hypothetical protein
MNHKFYFDKKDKKEFKETPGIENKTIILLYKLIKLIIKFKFKME